jgi:hypothetical protein
LKKPILTWGYPKGKTAGHLRLSKTVLLDGVYRLFVSTRIDLQRTDPSEIGAHRVAAIFILRLKFKS